jgi:hypothetical protein
MAILADPSYVEAAENFAARHASGVERIFGFPPPITKVFKAMRGSYVEGKWPRIAIVKDLGNSYYRRAWIVKLDQEEGYFWGFYEDHKKRMRSGRFMEGRIVEAGLDVESAIYRQAFANELRGTVLIDTTGVRLTSYGIAWWSTLGDLEQKTVLGRVIEWPALASEYPEVMDLPVRVAFPSEKSGWKTAAIKASYQEVPPMFREGSEILIRLPQYKHPMDVVQSLVHEAAHAVQAKTGTWRRVNLLHGMESRRSPIEAEAKRVAQSVPSQNWPANHLGPISMYGDFKVEFAPPITIKE